MKEEKDVQQDQAAYRDGNDNNAFSEYVSRISDGKEEHDGLHVIPDYDAGMDHALTGQRGADGHPSPKSPMIKC